MEQEEEANSRKRKGAPNLALAKELDGPPWDIQDRQPQAKVSGGELPQAGSKSLVAGSRFLQHLKGPCTRIRAQPTDLTELCSLICKIGITGYHLFQALSIV